MVAPEFLDNPRTAAVIASFADTIRLGRTTASTGRHLVEPYSKPQLDAV